MLKAATLGPKYPNCIAGTLKSINSEGTFFLKPEAKKVQPWLIQAVYLITLRYVECGGRDCLCRLHVEDRSCPLHPHGSARPHGSSLGEGQNSRRTAKTVGLSFQVRMITGCEERFQKIKGEASICRRGRDAETSRYDGCDVIRYA